MARILVIDDSLLQRAVRRAMLERAGYEVLEAADGAAGLELAGSEPVDCVLLDVLMPGMDGYEVLEALEQEHPGVPAIIVTADVQKKTREKCLALGAFRVLDKVQDEEELQDAVREVVERRDGSDQ